MVIFERKSTLNQYIKDYIIIFKRNKQKQMTVNQNINYIMIIFKRNKQKQMPENQLYNLSLEGIFKMV